MINEGPQIRSTKEYFTDRAWGLGVSLLIIELSLHAPLLRAPAIEWCLHHGDNRDASASLQRYHTI